MYHQSWDFPVGNPGRYADNPNYPFNIIVSSLSQAGADIVFAAGNCGQRCPDARCQGVSYGTIMGANSHPDVVTVGGVDITGTLAGYSSHGPGLLANDKPDLTMYTHFLGSQVFGPNEPDLGTSAACPLAAGVIAAVRSTKPFVRGDPTSTPAQLKSWLLARGAQASWSPDVGHGLPAAAQLRDP